MFVATLPEPDSQYLSKENRASQPTEAQQASRLQDIKAGAHSLDLCNFARANLTSLLAAAAAPVQNLRRNGSVAPHVVADSRTDNA